VPHFGRRWGILGMEILVGAPFLARFVREKACPERRRRVGISDDTLRKFEGISCNSSRRRLPQLSRFSKAGHHEPRRTASSQKTSHLTRNATLLDSFPFGVVTSIVPEVAPLGTVALMKVPETTVNVADTPLNVTLVVPAKLFPRMPITRPALPKPGFACTKGPRPKEILKTVPQPFPAQFVVLPPTEVTP
jgi:hypothetical protein